MKPICFFSICLGLFLSAFYGYGAPKAEETVEDRNNLSLRNEVGRAIERGVKWLATEQNATSGLWGDEEYPAITGLSLRAIHGDPARNHGDKYSCRPGQRLLFYSFQNPERWRYLRQGPRLLQYFHLPNGPPAAQETRVQTGYFSKPATFSLTNSMISTLAEKTTMFSTGGLVMAPAGLIPISPILTSQWKRSSTPRK